MDFRELIQKNRLIFCYNLYIKGVHHFYPYVAEANMKISHNIHLNIRGCEGPY